MLRCAASLLALYALAARGLPTGAAWTIDAPPAAAPEDIVGEHQPLARTLLVSSGGCLDALYLAIPGRVFVELDPSALPPPPVAEPPTDAPTDAPTEPPTEAPLPVLPPPVVPIGDGSGSGLVGNASSGSGSLSGASVEFPTLQLRRHRDEDEDEDEDEDKDYGRCRRRSKKHGKKHGKKRHADENEDEDASVVARVVVTGDSAELLDMLEAVPVSTKRSDALKLHLKNADAAADGFLLTTVFVMDARSLRSITTAFDGDVVVDDRVLALVDDREALAPSSSSSSSADEDEDLKTRLSLSVVGPGNLLVVRPDSSQPTGSVSLGSLNIVVTGSGSVQLPFLSGAELRLAKSLEVDVAGSGAVVLAPDAVTVDWVSASVTGAGAVVVESRGAVNVLSSAELSVFGSGALSVATSGSVPKEKLQLSGSGQLLAGSLKADRADVSVWGKGQVLVQAVRSLTVSTSVWGAVGFVNARPARVQIDGWWFWRTADEIVYPAETNTMLPAVFDPQPPKYPTYYLVETTRNRRDDDPDYTAVTTDEDDSEDGSEDGGLVSMAVAQAAAVTANIGVLEVAAAVGVVGAVAAVAARAIARFRVRSQYTRLV